MTEEFKAPTAAELEILQQQLGRPARGVLEIAAYTAKGVPTVVATSPRLPDGSPFPTFYYLTHPEAVAAASRLEAAGYMVELNQMLAEDSELQKHYSEAHTAYIAARERAGIVPELAGISAGGMPVRVKCLHALIGHALAAGTGVNPIGDIALAASGFDPAAH